MILSPHSAADLGICRYEMLINVLEGGVVVELGCVLLTPAATQVVDDITKFPGAEWFPGARLNFAENLLRFSDDHPAYIYQVGIALARSTHFVVLVLCLAGFISSLSVFRVTVAAKARP